MSDATPPDRVETPPAADAPRLRELYRHLATTGGGSTEGIAEALDVHPSTLLPALTTLDRRGAVERVDGEYVVRRRETGR